MSEENKNGKEEQKPPISFIEQFIIDDLKSGKNERQNSYQISSRTKRIPAYRSCKGYLSRFRDGKKIRRKMQSSL